MHTLLKIVFSGIYLSYNVLYESIVKYIVVVKCIVIYSKIQIWLKSAHFFTGSKYKVRTGEYKVNYEGEPKFFFSFFYPLYHGKLLSLAA